MLDPLRGDRVRSLMATKRVRRAESVVVQGRQPCGMRVCSDRFIAFSGFEQERLAPLCFAKFLGKFCAPLVE